MTLSIGHKIALGFLFALAVLLVIGTVSSLNLRELNSDADWVTHTIEVQQHLEGLQAGLLQSESAARGYQLVPDNASRVSFERGYAEVTQDLQIIRNLTSDNLHQQQKLAQLAPLLDQRYKDLRQLLALRDAATVAEDPQRTALVRNGRDSMETIHQLLVDMTNEEQDLLKTRQEKATWMAQATSATIIYGTLLAFVLVGLGGWMVTRSITGPLRVLGEGATRIGAGDYAERVSVKSSDEVGRLARIFNTMAEQVEQRQKTQADQDWLKSSLARFALLFQGQRERGVVCQGILTELATLLDARHSVLYVVEEEQGQAILKLRGSYAAKDAPEEIQPGKTLVGQCFQQRERLVVRDVPDDYFKISSVLGEGRPRMIAVQPAFFYGNVKAVLELAAFREFTPVQLALLDQLSESIGTVLNTLESVARTEMLLDQSQALSRDLQDRQVELERQTERLRQSEIQLQEQQEELKQTNEELEQTNEELEQTNEQMEEKVNLLAEQKREMERSNREVENARLALEEKARQLAQASKYKSDFLASMSHELRTPLNSLLILSKILADNGETNLSERQVQYARTIYSSGNDLLELINDILDLSKIESGAVDLDIDDVDLPEIGQYVENTFRHLAEQKRLEFGLTLAPGTPATVRTDQRRLQQILKNLLSNAFKFTSQGSIRVEVKALNDSLAFAVADTGIGIAPEKQQLIFEAFQQADAGTARQYGGTGLGLSISRELATLLGGEIKVTSVPGQGSTFNLIIPRSLSPGQKPREASRLRGKSPTKRIRLPLAESPISDEPIDITDTENVRDDRAALEPGDHVLLIIEDDAAFAGIMRDLAREKRFKVLLARNARQGIALATRLNPSAITLDLHLPDNDGWVVLDHLKHDPRTRHIPIHIISVDEERERSLRLGAVSYFQKPMTKETLEDALNQTIEFINRPLKNLLIIEDDASQRQSLVELIGNGDVHSTAVGTAAEAFARMDQIRFDCIVLDLGLPDKNGFDLIREIHAKYGPHAPPIIVYTGKELSREEETELRLISESIVIKNVRSPERLLDETALFLHRVQTKLPEPKRRMIEDVQKKQSILAGRKVLVVDDDVRNIFAITSALEASHMQVSYAESGQIAIELLEKTPGIEIVLMDVMMPGMDGFEAIRRIRKIDRFKKLPIISVTAKAMKGDREKCLEAGASDYITKPVDMDQLRSLLRVWLYR